MKERKTELVKSKSGRWYHRSKKRDKCIDCGTEITLGSQRCFYCAGRKRCAVNTEAWLNGEEFDRKRKINEDSNTI